MEHRLELKVSNYKSARGKKVLMAKCEHRIAGVTTSIWTHMTAYSFGRKRAARRYLSARYLDHIQEYEHGHEEGWPSAN